MDFCHVCDKQDGDLAACDGCGQDVCPDCCVDITPHNMIDFPFCKICEDGKER